MSPNPVLVEVARGDAVESYHRGAFAVVDSGGSVLKSAGDIDRPCFARSAIKPLQAIAFVESGATARFDLGMEQLALACASHNAEPRHVELVRQWLATLGLNEQDLECGAHLPYHEPSRHQLVRDGIAVDAAFNNCSGKHCGLLSTAKALGHCTAGYIDADHPVQIGVRRVLGEMTDLDLGNAPVGVDGCGIPVTGISIEATAYAMARFADPAGLGKQRQHTIAQIHAAVTADPFLVAGSNRFCTDIMRSAGAALLVKTGAEGFFCAAVPALKVGIALKIDDGATRASEVAMASILADLLESHDAALASTIARSAKSPVHNVAGRGVGQIAAVSAAVD